MRALPGTPALRPALSSPHGNAGGQPPPRPSPWASTAGLHHVRAPGETAKASARGHASISRSSPSPPVQEGKSHLELEAVPLRVAPRSAPRDCRFIAPPRFPRPATPSSVGTWRRPGPGCGTRAHAANLPRWRAERRLRRRRAASRGTRTTAVSSLALWAKGNLPQFSILSPLHPKRAYAFSLSDACFYDFFFLRPSWSSRCRPTGPSSHRRIAP
jgi:hypothetical protein